MGSSWSDEENLSAQQQAQPVPNFDGKSIKHWVDKRANNCFLVLVNGLKIIWIDTPKYWRLQTINTSDFGQITIGRLIDVCWLDIRARLHISNLSPGVTYQVAFLIMMEFTISGWGTYPVHFGLTLPNGTKQEHKEYLNEKPRGEWLRIPAGEVKVSPENIGEFEFYLYEHGDHWKSGLVVKGVITEPKN